MPVLFHGWTAGAAIEVGGRSGVAVAQPGTISEVRIHGNSINSCDMSGVYVYSASHVSVQGNYFFGLSRLAPSFPTRHILQIEACDTVLVDGNKAKGCDLGPRAVLLTNLTYTNNNF